MKVLIDTNVILDVPYARKEFVAYTNSIIEFTFNLHHFFLPYPFT